MNLPRISTGLISAFKTGYGTKELRQDILAGLTVGIVAVPLAMALAIATGVPPQHGLYTAIIAGALIALTGGSRFNVSGPTAAFVVILFPIVQQHGLGGLLLATMMAGVIMLALGLTRMGVLIQYVPHPVVLGFTAGIAVVIAVLQIPDFLGLSVGKLSEHFVENIGKIFTALPSINPAELAIGAFTLMVLLLWPRLKLPIPAPLAGLIAGASAAYVCNHYLGDTLPQIETIASRFTWEVQGQSGFGIPPILPDFTLPWLLIGANGEPLMVNFGLIQSLLGPAFAIAMLGAIESLLCAVIADGMTHTKHDPNAELIGQGLGNIIVPFFGGITATAALARTATSIRSGARSPIAALVHSIVVLLAVVAMAGVLGLLPMASLAALLFIVAWNMSEARLFVHTLKSAPRGDVAILLICFGLTVIFDMVIAVAVGIGLAAALFIRQMASLTHSKLLNADSYPELPKEIAIYDINGPMFFGAAEKVLSSLHIVDAKVRVLIVDMSDVPSMDASAIVALHNLIADIKQQRISMVIVGLPTRIIIKLQRAGITKSPGVLSFRSNISEASALALRWLSK